MGYFSIIKSPCSCLIMNAIWNGQFLFRSLSFLLLQPFHDSQTCLFCSILKVLGFTYWSVASLCSRVLRYLRPLECVGGPGFTSRYGKQMNHTCKVCCNCAFWQWVISFRGLSWKQWRVLEHSGEFWSSAQQCTAVQMHSVPLSTSLNVRIALQKK